VHRKPIEFDKGKSGIAVASVEKLPGMIDTLIGAVRNGGAQSGGETAADAEKESRLKRLRQTGLAGCREDVPPVVF
jgi:hypothetical protein